MILWRLTWARHEATALQGIGARFAGGRWNSKGRPAAYLSLESATTVLETLTTFTSANAPGEGYRLLKIDYQGSVFQPPVATLPPHWDRPDDPSSSRIFGDAFLSAHTAGVMLVPCAFLKSATNAVLNPIHPDASKAKVIESVDFSFDPRWPLK